MRISDWSSDVCSSDLAEATRRAVRAWGLEVLCKNPRHYSSSLTAVMVPPGSSADHFRKVTLEHFDMSLGSGLSQVADKVFRIGHLGDLNDLMLMGTLRSEEHTSEPQSLMRNSYAAFCLIKKIQRTRPETDPIALLIP